MRVPRWLGVVLVAASAAAVAASCSSGPAHFGEASPPACSPGGPVHPVLHLVSTPGAPRASTRTAAAPHLPDGLTALTSAGAAPFGVVVSADGRFAFVSVTGGISTRRLSPAGGPAWALPLVKTPFRPLGEVLTGDGRYLLAADGRGGIDVIDVRRAEQGGPGALLGSMNAPEGFGAIEVAVSPDDRFAFVSIEGSHEIAVFRLAQAIDHGFSRSDYVGAIPAGMEPVGLAVAPDGRWLYATSEGYRTVGGTGFPQGTLTVINLRRAETNPAGSAVTTVTAGCSPVRVAVSADGQVVWVTARESDSVLGFSAARLLTSPARALIAEVRVGEAPVGLALVKGGTRLVVADSNRFNAPHASASLAVVSVPAALAGRPGLLGYLPAGGFPREMTLEPAGRVLLVTNFNSGQLETVNVPGLP